MRLKLSQCDLAEVRYGERNNTVCCFAVLMWRSVGVCKTNSNISAKRWYGVSPYHRQSRQAAIGKVY